MNLRRRWFQYSLRSFLILLTVFAVWLGVVVNRAREQREAVKAIEALGGVVLYDWEFNGLPLPTVRENPNGPHWLRQLVGDDFFQDVQVVVIGLDTGSYRPSQAYLEIDTSISLLRRLPTLKEVYVPYNAPDITLSKLRKALPTCKVTLDFLGAR